MSEAFPQIPGGVLQAVVPDNRRVRAWGQASLWTWGEWHLHSELL